MVTIYERVRFSFPRGRLVSQWPWVELQIFRDTHSWSRSPNTTFLKVRTEPLGLTTKLRTTVCVTSGFSYSDRLASPSSPSILAFSGMHLSNVCSTSKGFLRSGPYCFKMQSNFFHFFSPVGWEMTGLSGNCLKSGDYRKGSPFSLLTQPSCSVIFENWSAQGRV